ncbi:MAG: phosphatidate cytidylyltransferase [Acidobacteriota bacterium]
MNGTNLFNNLKKRVPIAIILLTIAYLAIMYLPDLFFFLLLQIVIILCLREFYSLSKIKKFNPSFLLGALVSILLAFEIYTKFFSWDFLLFILILIISFYFLISTNSKEKLPDFFPNISITLFGIFYISFTLNFLFYLKIISPLLILFLLLVIYLGDTGAYFIGYLFGNRKIFPIASPNKTLEGFFGGIVFSLLGGIIGYYAIIPGFPYEKILLTSILLSLVAQLSDPFESLFKRASEVKNSSSLLGEHGGILDRLDSLIFSSPFFYFIIKFYLEK